MRGTDDEVSGGAQHTTSEISTMAMTYSWGVAQGPPARQCVYENCTESTLSAAGGAERLALLTPCLQSAQHELHTALQHGSTPGGWGLRGAHTGAAALAFPPVSGMLKRLAMDTPHSPPESLPATEGASVMTRALGQLRMAGAAPGSRKHARKSRLAS